jgi:hypothetical protein
MYIGFLCCGEITHDKPFPAITKDINCHNDMSTIVTDGELGKLAIKQHELFIRVKKGTLQIDQVLAALQSVIEGKGIQSSRH